MFRVIIAGGRGFDDYQLLKATMDKLLCNITDEITVVCGQAKGADTLGGQYAMEKGYAILPTMFLSMNGTPERSTWE